MIIKQVLSLYDDNITGSDESCRFVMILSKIALNVEQDL